MLRGDSRIAATCPQLTLEQAQTIIMTALRHGTEHKFQPLAVAVLDERGVLKAFAAQDGTSLRRATRSPAARHMARCRSASALARWRSGPRRPPQFIAAVTHAVGGSLIPVPGGVLIRAPTRRSSARSAFPATIPTTTKLPRSLALPPRDWSPILARGEHDRGHSAVCCRYRYDPYTIRGSHNVSSGTYVMIPSTISSRIRNGRMPRITSPTGASEMVDST